MSQVLPLLTPPSWVLMWGLAFVLYALLKGLSWITRRQRPAPLWRHVAYLFGWPGMDVEAFLHLHAGTIGEPPAREWCLASLKLLLGVTILAALVPRTPSSDPYVLGWIGMVGIAFTLHFGLFHLLSCLWRQLGVAAVPIMSWPIASQSLTEFWGQRWNLAFRDLAHRFLFRPLQRRGMPRLGLLAGFLASGLIHDAVVSWPAGKCYGGPTVYFILQGVGILFERSRAARWIGLGSGLRGWLFSAVVIIGPCGLLFHRPFVCDVVYPFLQALGSAP